MRARFFGGVVLLALSCGCSAAGRSEDLQVERFGAPLRGEPEPLTIEALLAAPERHDGTDVVVEGRVDEVCPKKGCWMTLSAGERSLRVTFQDYGFFVPLDSAGSSMRAAGRFAVVEVPVDEARHYLEDAGRHAEAAQITAPVRSYSLVATGVELVRD